MQGEYLSYEGKDMTLCQGPEHAFNISDPIEDY